MMNYQGLMKMPTGTIFYEDDLTGMPLFQIVEVLADDIFVRELVPDFEVSRMGWRESAWARGKAYRIFTAEGLDLLKQFIGVAELSIRQ